MIRRPWLALLGFVLLLAVALWTLGHGYGWHLLGAANLALYLLAPLTLGWFLFGVVGRKLWRARRIRNLRESRLLREAAQRKTLH